MPHIEVQFSFIIGDLNLVQIDSSRESLLGNKFKRVGFNLTLSYKVILFHMIPSQDWQTLPLKFPLQTRGLEGIVEVGYGRDKSYG